MKYSSNLCNYVSCRLEINFLYRALRLLKVKLWHLFLLPFLLVLLVDVSFAQIISKTEPCSCIVIDKNTNIKDKPFGKNIAQLQVESAIKIGIIKDGWAEIFYSQKQSLADCKSTVIYDNVGWISTSDIPNLLLLTTNSIPIMANKNKLFSIKKQKTTSITNGSDIWNFRFGKTVILKVDTTGFDTGVDKANYWVLYTGSKEFPYLLFYSGFTNDVFGDKPVMVFFGNKTKKMWFPNIGDRVVDSELLNVGINSLVITEAFYCLLQIKTTLSISKDATVKRIDGVFSARWSNVNKGISSADEPKLILTDNLILYKNENKSRSFTIKKGEIELRLVKVDFKKNLVKVLVNSKPGWIEFQKIVEVIPQLSNFACCGCG